MCGIVGAVSSIENLSLTSKDIEIFEGLLYCSALRGQDSTGIMIWTGTSFETLKGTCSPEQFIFSKEYQKFIKKFDKKIYAIFGHTRLATSGKISVPNSHPFIVNGNISLVHNGNVKFIQNVNIKEYEVDSLALAFAIEKAAKSPEKVFETFDGAVATVWLDARDQTLNVFRNDARPLASKKAYGVTWIASERGMLNWIVGRTMQNDTVPALLFDTNVLFKFDLNNPKNDPQKIEVIKNTSYDDTNHLYNYPYGDIYSPHKNWEFYKNKSKYKPKTNDTLPPPKEEPKDTFIVVKSINVYAKDKEIVMSAYDWKEYEQNKFKIFASPIIVDGQTPEVEGTCLIFTRDIETVNRLTNAFIIKGKINSIKYNKDAPTQQERVTLYMGNVQVCENDR